MRVSSISDQGTSDRREDGLVLGPSFFCVLDGVSAPSPYLVAPAVFGKLSGGEMVARTVERVGLACSQIDDDLRTIMRSANNAVMAAHAAKGISVDDTGKLAGAVFAAASVTEEHVRILQTGDCYAW